MFELVSLLDVFTYVFAIVSVWGLGRLVGVYPVEATYKTPSVNVIEKRGKASVTTGSIVVAIGVFGCMPMISTSLIKLQIMFLVTFFGMAMASAGVAISDEDKDIDQLRSVAERVKVQGTIAFVIGGAIALVGLGIQHFV